jgi:methionyl-tRNA formyltransferase
LATLDGIAEGSLEAREQPADGVSFAPKVQVDDARIDWNDPAAAIDRQVRACTPFPGAWTTYDGERVKVGPVTAVEADLTPGVLEVTKSAVLVGTAGGAVRLGEVKPHGRRQMGAADWARGVHFPAGAAFR